jgi:hypothetical protein
VSGCGHELVTPVDCQLPTPIADCRFALPN